MMDHPPVPVEHPLPDSPAAPGSPQVLDGAVYLPAGHPVAAESKEFDLLLRKHLPPEIAADVMGQWRGLSRRSTRLQWIVSLICLLAAFGLVYFFFPRTHFDDLKEHEGMDIRSLADPLPFNSAYRSLCNEADLEYSRGNYHAVCRLLKDSVGEIIRTKNRKADRVLFLYFKAMQNIHKNGPGSSDAAGLLRELILQDPDNPNWRQFEFELSPRIRLVLDFDEVRRRILSPEGCPFKVYLTTSQYALDRLAGLERTAVPPKYTGAELEKLKETIDIYKVKILISRWLLNGYKTGKRSLPDNENDPGVADREAALRIALKREDSSCKDFWQARLFIAETLCGHDSLFNNIYWHGAYWKTKDRLKQEIGDCRERLNGRKQL